MSNLFPFHIKNDQTYLINVIWLGLLAGILNSALLVLYIVAAWLALRIVGIV